MKRREEDGYSGRYMSLEEVGKELGVTAERVRQIEKSALEKMRRRFNAACLSEVMNEELKDVVWQ